MGRSRSDPENFAELVEIERASAKLHGRDPDRAEQTVRERLRQIAEKGQREKRNEAEKMAHETWRRRRPFVIAAAVVAGLALIAGAILGGRWLMAKLERAEAFAATLDEAAARLDGLGLSLEDEWADAEGGTIELSIPERTCSALVGVAEGSAEPLKLSVTRPGGRAEGGPLLFCGCSAEAVTVAFRDPPAGHLALRWLTGPLADVGGGQALAEQVKDRATVHRLAADESCAYAAAAEWVKKSGRVEPVPFPETLAKNPKFVVDGAEPVGVFEPERSFVAIASDADSCHFVQPFGEGGQLVLRDEAGEPVGEPAEGALGWCNYADAATLTLWRAPGSEAAYAITRAPAMRMGGLTGLRELAARQGHPEASHRILGEDFAQDAKAALVASSVGAATVAGASPTGLPGSAGHRIIAATLGREATLSPAEERVTHACDPEPVVDVPFTSQICIQAAAQKWRVTGEGRWGAVEGEVPVWLWELAEAPSKDALEAMVAILALARRLHLAGFEPTSVDGVESTIWGAEISRRGKATEVVALAITDEAPWFHPLSDGEPWSLDDEPRVVAMPAEGKLTLKAAKMLTYAPSSRSAVVWRR